MHIFIHLFVLLLTKSSGKKTTYLNPKQWADIRYCLLHPATTCEQRTQIQEVLFEKYMDTSARQAYQFHRSVRKNVRWTDMVQYAHVGLWRAIQKYNASMPFTKAYFSHYVYAYLMQGYAKCHPLTLVPVYKRIRRKWVPGNYLPILYGMDDYLIENQQQHWIRSDPSMTHDPAMTPFQKRIVLLKYYVNGKKNKRSNKEIAKYVGCSEETVRTTLKKLYS